MNRGRGKVAVGENEPLKSACWGFAFKWSEREREEADLNFKF